MENSANVDRRDVAHPTDPIGGNDLIERDRETNLAGPLDADAAKLPAGGKDAGITGVPGSNADANEKPTTEVYGGMPRGVPPARSGQSQADAEPAEPNKDNPGRMNRPLGRDTVHVQSPDKIGQ